MALPCSQRALSGLTCPYQALKASIGPYQALITYPITYPIRLHGGPIRSQIALSGCQSTLVGSQTALSEYQALALRVLYQALKSQMALIRLSEGPMAYKALSDSQSTLVAGSWGTLSGS
jgi:hypothetical protein